MMAIRWGRVVAGAVLLELALFVVLVPLALVLGVPLGDLSIPVPRMIVVLFAAACLVFGFFAGAWVARKVTARFALHGALTGAVATLIYLAICSIPPGSIAATMAWYGPFSFFLLNALRIVGCIGGSWFQSRSRAVTQEVSA